MATVGIGRQAEAAVADYLTEQGYKVLELNWRTRWCEIDIIAQKDVTIYFIEVKYRGSEAQGSGFEYIGPQKTRQMEFAARLWVSSQDWSGDYQIIAAEAAGRSFDSIDLVEIY